MAHIFISYDHQDSEYAQKVRGALTEQGFEVWIDDRIDYGTRWPQVIEEHLDSSATLLLIMTPRAKRSEWVQNELARAQRTGKPVFPLLLEGDPWLAVEATQYVDVRDQRLPPPLFYDRLAHVLSVPSGAAPPPPKPAAAAERQSVAERQSAARLATPPRSRWRWVAGSVLALLVLGSAYFGIRAALRSRTSRLQVGTTRTREQDEAVMVYVPAGAFWMGSTDEEIDAVLGACGDCKREWYADEQPRHEVSLEAYWIDRSEVTNVQYKRCVDAGVCSPPEPAGSAHRESYYGNPEFDDYPVVNVTWHQARAYAEWVGGRLPTEAEWEYACRGSGGQVFPWGNGAPNDTLLNYKWTVNDTARAGAYPEGASWCGALDLSGNVWEWTQSAHTSYPYDPADGRENLHAGGRRVARGGSFEVNERNVRCAYRGENSTGSASPSQGFRVLQTQ